MNEICMQLAEFYGHTTILLYGRQFWRNESIITIKKKTKTNDNGTFSGGKFIASLSKYLIYLRSFMKKKFSVTKAPSRTHMYIYHGIYLMGNFLALTKKNCFIFG